MKNPIKHGIYTKLKELFACSFAVPRIFFCEKN